MSCACPDEVNPIGVLDFKLPIGSTYSLPLTWGPLDAPAELQDFTGYTSEFVIHQNNELGPVVATLTTSNGGIDIDTTTITALFTPENVGHLRIVPHAYFWRVVSPAPSSVPTTLFKGTLTPLRA